MDHFLKCHLLVIALLDKASEIGILKRVNDEGGFWKKRDLHSLAKEVVGWNSMVASVLGEIQQAGFKTEDLLVSPITKHPDYPGIPKESRTKLTDPGNLRGEELNQFLQRWEKPRERALGS